MIRTAERIIIKFSFIINIIKFYYYNNGNKMFQSNEV